MFHMHDDNGVPVPGQQPVRHLDGEWARSTDFQRNTVRAYWLCQLPWQFSVSGLYFYGSGNAFSTT